jgi:phosphate starvation-inducible PhoH-like protein
MTKRNNNKLAKKQQEEKDFEELKGNIDEKLNFNLKDEIKNIINKDIKIIAKNESQKELIQSIKNNEITICSGRAGTGKTFLSVGYALSLIMKQESPYKKIYLIKSVTSLPGEEIGWLKGSYKEKVEPFMWSYYINIEKLISKLALNQLLEKEFIQPFPLAYVRGASLDNCIMILDEGQNLTISNSRTFLTRLGENSKIIMLGDTNQIDIKNKEESSLSILINMFKNTSNIGIVEMNDSDTNVRNPIIDTIENKFNEYNLNSNGQKKNNKLILNG